MTYLAAMMTMMVVMVEASMMEVSNPPMFFCFFLLFFFFRFLLQSSLISYFLFLISFFSNSRYYLTFFPLHSSPISCVFILFVFKFLILIVDKKYQNLSSCILLVNSFINFMIVNYIINYH